jgi:hypothetical protein
MISTGWLVLSNMTIHPKGLRFFTDFRALLTEFIILKQLMTEKSSAYQYNFIIFRVIHFRTKREVFILVYIGPAVLELYYFDKYRR